MAIDGLRCDKHNVGLECLAGRNAHPSNWYCPKCDDDTKDKPQANDINLRVKFTENAEQFDSLMVEMLEENEKLRTELKLKNDNLQDRAMSGGEIIRELISGVRSINTAKHHEINISNDDEPCYWQRKEWVDWILELADDAEREISDA